MQILAIIVYGAGGEQRQIDLKPGAMNVITGASSTGKSSLLDIVEYCLGRSTVTLAVGPLTRSTTWFACLLQLPDGNRAFVARPSPGDGAASSERAMLEIGSALEPLAYDALRVNADADTVRLHLGSLMGFDENRSAARTGGTTVGLEAHLGHAVLLCLQGQGEIGNRALLFHRQGESRMADAIRATLPYFLGAVPRDQALKRQQLDAAERDLRRVRLELTSAERAGATIDSDLQAMIAEAYGAGLIAQSNFETRQAAFDALTQALTASDLPGVQDDAEVARLNELNNDRADLRRQLREIGELKALLTDEAVDEAGYTEALSSERQRLLSISLFSDAEQQSDDRSCPVCGSLLASSDPTIEDIRQAFGDVDHHLAEIEAGRPRRQAALNELDERSDVLRQRIRGVEAALTIRRQDSNGPVNQRSRPEERAFVQGRIDASLRRIPDADAGLVERLRQRVSQLETHVESLRRSLDPDEEAAQVTSKLAVVGEDMTSWAARLRLEHSGRGVRLDPRRLTVVADTETGAVPLFRVGSAENWIGYHLVSHLALHRHFVRQNRPVPRFLMLDQPSQAYYPSEADQFRGIPADDTDRAAVERIYELIRDIVAELAPSFQVIVTDHANLAVDWFQTAVVENWRDGRKLIPDAWIQDNA